MIEKLHSMALTDTFCPPSIKLSSTVCWKLYWRIRMMGKVKESNNEKDWTWSSLARCTMKASDKPSWRTDHCKSFQGQWVWMMITVIMLMMKLKEQNYNCGGILPKLKIWTTRIYDCIVINLKNMIHNT